MNIFNKESASGTPAAPQTATRRGAAAAAARLRVKAPEGVAAIEAHAQSVGASAERERVLAIFRACKTMNQLRPLEKLIVNGVPEAEAIDHVTDIAAAADPGIHSSHSPEGGHRAPLDHAELYASRNGGDAA